MDSWLDYRFKSGCLAYDKRNKEHVLITNGRCTLSHESPESYRLSHVDGCIYTPSECIRVRVVGMEGKNPIIAWTYTSVDIKDLDIPFIKKSEFESMMNGKRSRRTNLFIGRI